MKTRSWVSTPFCRIVAGTFLLGLFNVARADVVIDWNVAMANYVTPRSPAPLAPFYEVRVYAMTHIAMRDAIEEALGHSLHRHRIGNPEAAAAQAAHDILVHEFADGASAFAALLAAQLAAIPDSLEKSNGTAIGADQAAAMLAARANDGASVAEGPYTPGTNPGDYQPTPPFDGPPFNGFVQAVNWGKVTPFLLKNGSQFRAPPPYKVTDLDYTFDLNEIKASGVNGSVARTPDQTSLAIFWAESSGLGWNRIARILAAQQANTLQERARLFASLNAAMADATIASFDSKFFYNFWRPITAIRQGASDGNDLTTGDAAWAPLLTTPPVPDYPSNHAAMGGAAMAVLSSFFGNERTFTLPSSMSEAFPWVQPRTFHRISDAAKENAISRMMLGIHFRLACLNGYDQGVEVGTFVVKRLSTP